jgi:xylulose-5-phosphate/fructose-6-phosphate phosphoketolase
MEFEDYFTKNKPVSINFHGYPQTIKQVLFDYGCEPSCFSIHGYEETGSTTTPFDMMVRNGVDRFHLAIEAFARAREAKLINKEEERTLTDRYEKKLSDHRAYVIANGDDPEEITNWSWGRH